MAQQRTMVAGRRACAGQGSGNACRVVRHTGSDLPGDHGEQFGVKRSVEVGGVEHVGDALGRRRR